MELSVIIPVYNEELALPALFARLYPALDKLKLKYEIIFINDGSRDRSAAVLRRQFEARPAVTRVVLLAGNFGQHMAIMAGFEQSRGDIVVTLDADLQNPPEEIAALVAKMHEGYDYVGTIRRKRQDSIFRRLPSRIINLIRERITHIKMTDQGCMLRAYSRSIVNVLNNCREVNTFIPALAYTFAQKPTEIEVAHEERVAGDSKYSIYKLMRLNFDLMTGFSIVPLQVFSILGIVVSLGTMATYTVVMINRWILSGSFRQGLAEVWDRDILQFFLIGIMLFGLGLLGEYVGRIYEQVRGRPRYLVDAVLEQQSDAHTSGAAVGLKA
ncbi:MAG TPA: glycosyltransferase [Burkholderiales bacterium]|nr:glycosyltransferase [Burkholderiales bacterium]